MKNILPLAFCVLFALACTGCGDPGPKRYPVTGEVTWQGQPVAEGSVVFTPVDKGVTDAGKIVAGKFEARVTAGKKKVEITATRKTGPVDPSMGMARRESYIPAKYNRQTTLEKEVTSAGENHFKFDLVP
jgi:hypothetical protein